MRNIIMNIKQGQGDDMRKGFDYARKVADAHQKETGNKCVVERIIDFKDKFNGETREHFSFDVVEIISD